MRSAPPALLRGALCLAFASLATAQEGQEPADPWTSDFAAAKTKAAADQKDLLLDFTGSDWCVWCKRLDKEVFAEASFQSAILKDFVLVKLDFPRDKGLVTAEVKEQNEKLQQEYGVEGYPTIFLADAAGRPYARTGYQEGGADKYLEHVAELRKAKAGRDEHFTKAKDLKGVERAKSLAAGLDAMDKDLVLAHYMAEVKEVIGLDEKGEGGLKARFEELLDRAEQKKVLAQLQQDVNAIAREGRWDDLVKKMDETLTANKGRKMVEQMATFFKAMALLEGHEDFDKALPLLDAALAFDPDSEMARQIQGVRKNVEQAKAGKEKAGGDKGKGGEEQGK